MAQIAGIPLGPCAALRSRLQSFLFIGMTISAQESTDVFDRWIMRVAGANPVFNSLPIGFGTVFRSIPQMRHLMIGEEYFLIVRNPIDNSVSYALGNQAAFNQMD